MPLLLIILLFPSVCLSSDEKLDFSKNIDQQCVRECASDINFARELVWKAEEKAKAKDTIMSCQKKCQTDAFNEEELNMIDDIVSKLAQKDTVHAGYDIDFDGITYTLYGQAKAIVLKRRVLRNSQVSQDY